MISIVKDLKESTALPKEWQGFKPGAWTESIDVRDFIQHNYTPYSGNEEFLSGPSQRTLRLWDELKVLLKREIDNGGVLDADEEVVSSITSHKPGYIDKELEVVVGLQTDAPLKRALMPFGGLRMAQQALESYGFKMCEKTADIFKKIRKTHNEGVFDAYPSAPGRPATPACSPACRTPTAGGGSSGTTAGLPCTASTGWWRKKDGTWTPWTAPWTRSASACGRRCSEQIRALEEMKQMAARYGVDLSSPLRHCPGGGAGGLPGLSGRDQGEQRGRHLPGPHLHLPGHLPPAGPGGRGHHRGGGPGADRPVRDEAAAWSVPSCVRRSTTSCSAGTPPG